MCVWCVVCVCGVCGVCVVYGVCGVCVCGVWCACGGGRGGRAYHHPSSQSPHSDSPGGELLHKHP